MSRRHVPSIVLPGAAALASAALLVFSCAHAAKAPPRPLDPVQQAALINNADDAFLAARDAYRGNDPTRGAVFAARATMLDSNYPLASYLDYWTLRRQIADYGNALVDAAPDDAIRSFLARNPDSVVADLARRDWLIALGKRGEWTTFEAEFPNFALNDDAQVTCFHLTARALRQIRDRGPGATSPAAGGGDGGRTSTAELLRQSRAAIAQPRDYASDTGACATLARVLVADQRIAQGDIWGWIRGASDANNAGAARRYALLLTDAERGGDSVRFFKQLDAVLDKPPLWLARGGFGTQGTPPRWQRELAVIAYARMARADPMVAAASLERPPANHLTAADTAYLYAELGAAAAKKQMPEANEWSRKSLAAENLSEDILDWEVRGALRDENWKLVETFIDRMPPDMRRPQAGDGAWTYWLGRAYKAQKKNDAAEKQFRLIADQFGFYGQLATEELGQMITLPARAPPATEVEVGAARAQPGFARALYFYRIDLRREGNLEWNFALRGMTDRELLAAAEWASRNQLLDRAVNTADRTRNDHDFSYRFLMPYKPQMQEKTAAVGLDIDWVYGLIRQESRFVQVAHSSVGAAGLMQLMPSTARYVAKRIGLDGYRPDGVADIDTNLTLGTSYLRMVLDDLDNLPVLATAAYNAGPGRPRAWRATLTHPVEGAIFAETIPFPETRDYVKKVMSNATYYAVLITGTPQSLKTRMGFVSQRSLTADSLP